MSKVIEVEIDLAEYEDEIRDYLNGTLEEDLQEYVKELEKELFVYSTKTKTVESVYIDLLNMLKEN